MRSVHHIQTQRIVFEAEALTAASAGKWHQRLERLQDASLLPALEQQLDMVCPPGETIVLERVEVTLPIDFVDQLEREVPVVFAEELRLALRKAVAAAPVRMPALRILVGLLQSGRLDWRAGSIQAFVERLAKEAVGWETDEWSSFFEILSEDFQLFFGRLTQVQGRFIGLALAELRRRSVNQKPKVNAAGIQSQDQKIWQHLLLLAGYRTSAKSERLSQSSFSPVVRHTVPSSTSTADPAAEWFPPNSGLVILHPYLGYLARETKCISGETLDHDRLAALLHYAVSGKHPFEEWEHPLTKILMGLPPEMLLLPVTLEEADREQVDELLCGIIKHWSILKNTSPEGLRGGFLQRPGKLFATPGGWQLLVESKGHDLLLAHLPWGINLVKTPWMAEMLQVSWS